jgi:hypothetical protein
LFSREAGAVNTASLPDPDGSIQRSSLMRDYGIAAGEIRSHPGGFESDCWVVD